MSWLEFSPISPQLSLILVFGLLLLAAKLAQSLFGRLLRLGSLAALLVGLYLGPTGRNMMQHPWLAGVTSADHFQLALNDLMLICTWLLVFAIGLRIRFTEGPRFTLAVILAAIGAGGGGYFVAWQLAQRAGAEGPAALLLAAIGAAVSVTVTAASARELGKDNQPETAAAMTGWLVNNLWVWAILTLVVAQFSQPDRSAGAALATLLKSAVFLACATLLGYALFTWVGLLLARLRWSGVSLAWGLISALLMAVAAEYLAGVPAVTGALLAGIIYARLPQADDVAEELRGIVDGVVIPLLLVGLTLQIDLRAAWQTAGSHQLWLWAGLLLVGKLVPAALLTRATGATWAASVRVGTGMAAPGEIGLMLVAVGLSAGGLRPDLAGLATAIAVLPWLAQPLLLWLTWLPRRLPTIVAPAEPERVPERVPEPEPEPEQRAERVRAPEPEPEEEEEDDTEPFVL